MYTLYDNAYIFQGKPYENKNLRQEIWEYCDKNRTGVYDFAFDEDMSYEKYAENIKSLVVKNNIKKESKYYYLTELSIKCTAKRMYPDYISAKKMRENYEGNVFSPMGCRAFLPPYKDLLQ